MHETLGPPHIRLTLSYNRNNTIITIIPSSNLYTPGLLSMQADYVSQRPCYSSISSTFLPPSFISSVISLQFRHQTQHHLLNPGYQCRISREIFQRKWPYGRPNKTAKQGQRQCYQGASQSFDNSQTSFF